MSDRETATLAFWNEHRQQLRQSETQRANLTNYLLVITAGLTGLVVQQKFPITSLPTSFLIVIIGFYGAVASAKYHERAEYHLQQARALTRTLQGLGALADPDDNLSAAREAHYRKYPRLHRTRLHRLWTGLHIVVGLYGVALVVVTLIHG